MYRKSILVPVALAVLFVFAVLPSASQETTSDVGGHVSDPNGLAVAGAKVTVSNTNTGLLRVVETTETGDFSINKIPPGTYKITVEKTGFSTAVYDSVELNVGDKRNFDVPLAIGATSQTVMVTEEVPLIPTTSSEIQGWLLGRFRVM